MPGVLGWMPAAWRAHVHGETEIASTRLRLDANVDPRAPMSGSMTATAGDADNGGTFSLNADEATSAFGGELRGETRLGNGTRIHGGASGDNQGHWEWFSGIARKRSDGTDALTLLAVDGAARVEADASMHRGGHDGTISGDMNSEGNWHTHLGANHALSEATHISENIRLSRDGGLDLKANAEHRIGDSSRLRVSGDHSGDGTSHLRGEFEHRLGDSTRFHTSGERENGGSNHFRGGVEHAFDSKTDVRLEGERDHGGRLTLHGDMERRIGDTTTLRGGRRSDGAFHGGGQFSSGSNTANAEASWSKIDGLQGHMDATTRVGETGFSGGLRHGLDESEFKSGMTTHLSSLFGSSFNVGAGGDGSLAFRSGQEITLGHDHIGNMRRDVLGTLNPDYHFVEYGIRARAGANASLSLPFGAGGITTGMSAGREYDVYFVGLTQDPNFAKNPVTTSWRVPASRTEVLELSTGESFRIVGNMNHGLKLSGQLNGRHGLASATASTAADYVLSGDTSLEVFRGAQQTVRLVAKALENREHSSRMKIKLGANLGASGVAAEPVADMVARTAQGALEDWLGAGSQSSWEKNDKDDRLMDVSLDLGYSKVGDAYEKALGGDWTKLRELGQQGHPGIAINRFIFSSIQEKTESVSHFAFGSRHGEVKTETIGRADVFSEGSFFEVTTELDASSTETADWFKHHTYDVQDFSRLMSAADGASLGSIKAKEHWLAWSHEAREDFTSKDALLRGLGVARFLMRGESASKLKAYEAKIKQVTPRSRIWLGPRNELSKTSLKLKVTIDDAGLNALVGRTENEYWNVYAQAWRSIYPDRKLPVWADPVRRRTLSHRGPMNDNLADFAELYRVEQLIERLQNASDMDLESRNDMLRESLYENRRDEAWMAALALLAGREHLRVELSVDSTEGTDKTQFDASIAYKGNDFEIQEDVFGF